MAASRRNRVGSISLVIAVAVALAVHLLPRTGVLPESNWLSILGAGFDAAVIGGLADWFAVTALFRGDRYQGCGVCDSPTGRARAGGADST